MSAARRALLIATVAIPLGAFAAYALHAIGVDPVRVRLEQANGDAGLREALDLYGPKAMLEAGHDAYADWIRSVDAERSNQRALATAERAFRFLSDAPGVSDTVRADALRMQSQVLLVSGAEHAALSPLRSAIDVFMDGPELESYPTVLQICVAQFTGLGLFDREHEQVIGISEWYLDLGDVTEPSIMASILQHRAAAYDALANGPMQYPFPVSYDVEDGPPAPIPASHAVDAYQDYIRFMNEQGWGRESLSGHDELDARSALMQIEYEAAGSAEEEQAALDAMWAYFDACQVEDHFTDRIDLYNLADRAFILSMYGHPDHSSRATRAMAVADALAAQVNLRTPEGLFQGSLASPQARADELLVTFVHRALREASMAEPVEHEIVAAASGWLEELGKAHPDLLDRFYDADHAEGIAAAWATPEGYVLCDPCAKSKRTSGSAEE